ncbi:MAG TPA: chemotaxis protein CheA [Myxococcales bacterium]|nr:chemotaxis protein CheA [Myxococcales bacterium]
MKGPQEFVAEATEILDALGRDLLALDQRRGEEVHPEILNSVFRSAHTLKGLAGLFGEERISQLAHRTEDVLELVRLGKADLSDPMLDALIEGVDAFQALLEECARGRRTDGLTERAAALADRLERLAAEKAARSAKAPAPAEDPLDQVALGAGVRGVLTEYEEHRIRENVKKGVPLYRARAEYGLHDFDQRLTALTAAFRDKGEVLSTLPSQQPGESNTIAFDLLVSSREDPASLEATAAAAGAMLQGIPAAAPGLAPAAPAAPAAPSPERPDAEDRIEGSLRSLAQTVRVDIRRLDTLMNTVGELILLKTNLQRLADSALAGGVHAISRLWGQQLQRETRALERKLDDLQEGLLGARMVPLGQVFDKLTRLVRRIAREAGKEIDFQADGGEVELDKLIVEELSDPLMHIIRNAIDHGVEAPAARASAGKPRRGKVSLAATSRGNQVAIAVTDDGAGIDDRRVLEVAMQRGLVTPREARELSPREIHNLIFLPGFSTARSVSELSGRGVGLDVVKTNISNLSGLIDVTSSAHSGTTFAITLPVTLAIIRALVVSVSARTYAVPLNRVLEIVSVLPSELRTVERREMILVRGHTIPFARLSRIFGHPERPLSRLFAVVVGLAHHRVALAVDELVGQQDIVIKPLGPRLQHVRGFAGATDLGNLRAVLVLDVGALVEECVNPDRRADFL